MTSRDGSQDSARTLGRIPAPECALARLPLDAGRTPGPAAVVAELAAFRGALLTVAAFALEPRLRLDGTDAIELYAVTPPDTAPLPVVALREALLDVLESCRPPARPVAGGAAGPSPAPDAAERLASFRTALAAAAPRLLELLDDYLVELYA